MLILIGKKNYETAFVGFQINHLESSKETALNKRWKIFLKMQTTEVTFKSYNFIFAFIY